MQTKDKGIISFKINKGINNILFSNTEDEILSILGNPISQEYDKDADSKRFYYENFLIVFHYEKGMIDYLSIHLKSLFLNGTDISSLQKEKLIDFLRNIYKENESPYQYEYIEDDIEESYFFEGIGLTVWYEDNNVSDICVHEIM